MALAACASLTKNQKEATAHYKLGLSQMNSNNIQAAFVEFQKSLKLYDSDKEVHNAIGVVYMKLEDFENAEKAFKRAVSIDWDYSEAYNNLCYMYIERGDYEQGIEQCSKALVNKVYATPEKSFYSIGRAYYKLGNYPESIKNYLNATRRAPNMAQPFYGLALAYNASGNFGKASEAITRAIALDSRFRGDKAMADSEFRKQTIMGGEDTHDLTDLIEILKY